MGKSKNKNKDEVPNPTGVANRDILQRLNFLYQASVLLNGLAPPRPIPDDDDLPMPSTTPNNREPDTEGEDPSSSSQPKKSQRKKRRRVVSFGELSRSYVDTMKSVGQKTNVRMDPSVKRRICKRCSAPLIPGISSTVRVKESASHGHLISYRCHCCQMERRIPAPPVLRMDDEDTMEVQVAEASTSSTLTATAVTGNSVCPRRQRRRKGGPQPRLPPHFARDVGHIVFRGNERLEMTRSIS